MRSSSDHHPTSLESWGYGVLCVTLISLMSVTGVFLLPLMSKSFYRKLLSALIGLAVGSLLGEEDQSWTKSWKCLGFCSTDS